MTKALLHHRPPASPTDPSGGRGTLAAGVPSTSRVPPSAAELQRALDVSRERLRAALCRIDALETQSSLLKHQVALLHRTVAQARRFSYHDELTGLPNRRLLLDRYNQAVALAARQDRRVALLFLDLNGFKQINDAHGHAAGDRILQLVAERLRACLRTSDTASRYGGDEFVILLPELETRASAVMAAEKIRARIAVPYSVGSTEISLTASIGIAVYPVDGLAYDDLMRVSDGSMYRDKVDDDASAQSSDPGVQRAAVTAASMQAMDILMKARGSSVSIPKADPPKR